MCGKAAVRTYPTAEAMGLVWVFVGDAEPHPLTEQLPEELAAPTLIVWGSQNPFGDVPEARRMQEHIAGSVLRIFNNCEHWPQHEHAEAYNQLSIDFISSHG